MNDKIGLYLESLEVTRAIRASIEDAHRIAQLISLEEIECAVMTNIIADNSLPEYLNIWFFTPNYLMEARNFVHSVDIDVLPIKSNIAYARVKSENFNFEEADATSYLLVSFTAANNLGIGGELIAYGKNCDYLWEVYNNYFVKNLARGSVEQ